MCKIRVVVFFNKLLKPPPQWQLFISQMRLIKTYGHEGIRDTFSLVCVQNDRDSDDYILGTTAQSKAAKVAK